MHSMRSIRGDLFSAIGGPCKRYVVALAQDSMRSMRSMRGSFILRLCRGADTHAWPLRLGSSLFSCQLPG